MSGERFDYSGERQRHEKFVGRAGLLARLDQLLVAGGGDRWVVVTGGPGMGKSALLAAWLARRDAAGAAVPHHFIRRGQYDWDVPRVDRASPLTYELIAARVLRERGVSRRTRSGGRRRDAAPRCDPARRRRVASRLSGEPRAPRGP